MTQKGHSFRIYCRTCEGLRDLAALERLGPGARQHVAAARPGLTTAALGLAKTLGWDYGDVRKVAILSASRALVEAMPLEERPTQVRLLAASWREDLLPHVDPDYLRLAFARGLMPAQILQPLLEQAKTEKNWADFLLSDLADDQELRDSLPRLLNYGASRGYASRPIAEILRRILREAPTTLPARLRESARMGDPYPLLWGWRLGVDIPDLLGATDGYHPTVQGVVAALSSNHAQLRLAATWPDLETVLQDADAEARLQELLETA